GGGGLIGGIACALKESNPESNRKIQVFGVQPSRLPSMKVAVAEGKPVTLMAASTIADGIAVRRAGDRKLPLVRKKVAVLVCGGNIDVTLLSRIIERGLVKDGRLVRLRVHLPDYPG